MPSRRHIRVRQTVAAISAAAVLLVAGGDALADTRSADMAAAEALFDEAKRLVKDGKFTEACPKFAESLRLDAAVGTMLYLADCYETTGQTASAWAQFRAAAAAASASKQAEREKRARTRAAALEKKLLRLSIYVSASAAVEGFIVKRDGQTIGKPLWGTAMPLDPGEHRIEASAPGRKTWSTKVTLADGATAPVVVKVPALEVDLSNPASPSAAVEGPGPSAGGAPPGSTPPEGSRVPRMLGFAAIGLGAVGLVGGGAAGVAAILTNRSTKISCTPSNTCDPEGTSGRQRAVTLANASTIALIAGGLIATGGLITVIATNKSDPGARARALRLGPLVAVGGGGLLIEGGF